MFDPVYKAFGQIATAVLPLVEPPRLASIAPRRDDGGCVTVLNLLDELIIVVRFVGDAVSWSMLGQQSRGLLDVVLLARGDDQFDGTAFRIDREVQLGTESPARASQRFLLRTPFFAPAACW